MQITWYGHSAFRLDFGGNAVLIDPFFTGNPACPMKAEEAQAIYKQSLNEVPLMEASLNSGLKSAQLALQEGEAELKRLEANLNTLSLRAPFNGLVVIQTVQRRGSSDAAQIKVGDTVSFGQPVMQIGPNRRIALKSSLSASSAASRSSFPPNVPTPSLFNAHRTRRRCLTRYVDGATTWNPMPISSSYIPSATARFVAAPSAAHDSRSGSNRAASSGRNASTPRKSPSPSASTAGAMAAARVCGAGSGTASVAA